LAALNDDNTFVKYTEVLAQADVVVPSNIQHFDVDEL
jgi:hypothetical protein